MFRHHFRISRTSWNRTLCQMVKQSESYGHNHYFNIKFQRIDPPKVNEKDYEQKSKSSVVAEFNRAQQALGKETISAFTFREWLTKPF